jgi:hypothetical protein
VLRREVESARAALVSAGPLADRIRGRHTVAWAPDVLGTPLKHLGQVRQIALLLVFEGALKADAEQSDAALADCRAALNAARSIGDEPTLNSQLTRMVNIRLVLPVVEQILAQGEPSEAELAAIQRMLEDEATHPGFLIAMRGERAAVELAFSQTESGNSGTFAPSFWGVGDAEVGPPPAAPLISFLARPRIKFVHADALEVTDFAATCARLPICEQGPKMAGMPYRADISDHFLLRFMLTSAAQAESFGRGTAATRTTAVMVALERFRRARGRWPERLAELVPAYLREVPTDPFDGRPLRYRRRADGVVVYSIGSNLIDDGGAIRPAPPVTPGTATRPALDTGFQLWDVEHRRLPPLPPFVGPLLPDANMPR